MQETTEYGRKIRRVRSELNGKGIPRTSIGVRGLKTVKRKQCQGHRILAPMKKEKDPRVQACSRKAAVIREWAGHRLLFCKEHAEEWDNLMSYALIGFYEERFADELRKRERRNAKRRQRRKDNKTSRV